MWIRDNRMGTILEISSGSIMTVRPDDNNQLICQLVHLSGSGAKCLLHRGSEYECHLILDEIWENMIARGITIADVRTLSKNAERDE